MNILVGDIVNNQLLELIYIETLLKIVICILIMIIILQIETRIKK